MTALLRCENIHKSYALGRTRLPVLRGVDLSIQQGRLVAITGSSGSGKSTLLHVLSGLDVPQQGQVFYRNDPLFEPEGLRKIPVGRDTRREDFADEQGPPPVRAASQGLQLIEHRRNAFLNAAFGFVFQFYHLLPEFDVLENVLLPSMVGRSIGGWLENRAAGTQRALSLLDRVGLADRIRHRPNELSGGERQRVAIARALMCNPALLFADEPTGNLDARTGRGIFTLLRSLNETGQTLVMVTHDRDLASEADEVVHMVDGRLE